MKGLLNLLVVFLLVCLMAGIASAASPAPGEWKNVQGANESTFRSYDATCQYCPIWDGDHSKPDSFLVYEFQKKIVAAKLTAQGKNTQQVQESIFSLQPPPGWRGMPTKGTVKLPVFLVDFSDAPHDPSQTVAAVQSKMFGDGNINNYPYESLKNYYQRSSYNQLTITGDVYGWYRAAHPRSYYQTLGYAAGSDALINEILLTYDNQINFANYDADHNGKIDGLFINWAGPNTGWGTFWWAWMGAVYSPVTVDGVQPYKIVWSWNDPTYSGYDIHETGHLLGLPDYYDYDSNVGPKGGVGGWDMMDSNWGDHNAFSKYLLGWIDPMIISSGTQEIILPPSGTASTNNAVLIMPDAVPDTFSEFFMVQYREPGTGNDPPQGGLGDSSKKAVWIWHVDATLTPDGTGYANDNSYTDHKLLRLMEADGREQIEAGSGYFDVNDFYIPGQVLSANTLPDSDRYSGAPTMIKVSVMEQLSDSMKVYFSDATLYPSSAIGFQGSESSLEEDHSPYIQYLDGGWAPPTSLVTNNYYATGLDPSFWDAISVKFNTDQYNPSEYTAILRFYAQEGSYWNNQWNHYMILPGEKNPTYQDNDWETVSTDPKVHSISNSGGSWFEEVLPSSYWNSGSFWITLRMWNVRLDTVELVLIPNDIPSITVTSPNGGESWIQGSNHAISWTSTGDVGSNVKIEVLKAGSVVQTLSSSDPNDGTFSWTIASALAAGTDYRIRITSTTNTAITDSSNANFAITTPSITVTSPNGAESWIQGSNHAITWTSSGTVGSYVKVEVLKAGSVVQTLSSSTENDGTYSWTIPTTLTTGTDYRVRITSTTNTAVMDVSNNYFTITTSTPSITVTAPNGGETWNKGTSYPITWSSTGSLGSSVNIALFNGNSFLNYITTNVPIGSGGSGSYTWQIPAGTATGSTYKIGVQSASQTSIYDLSNANFAITSGTITPSITVTSPNGAESWIQGSNHAITWTSTGDVGSNVKIEVLKAGSVVQTLSSSDPNDGTFSWTIATTLVAGTDYRIRVTSTTTTAITDSSNADFGITPATTPTITVTAPNGAESWAQGSNHAITWTSIGDVGSNVKIEVLKAGSVVQTLSSSDPNDGTFSWTIATTLAAGTDYRIRITSTTTTAITDSSNANFAITSGTITPSITVTSPNGGESWQRGTSQTVTWSSTGSLGSSVNIALFNGNSFLNYITTNVPIGSGGSGSYTWQIPAGTATGSTYKIGVQSASQTSIYDLSNIDFTITSTTIPPSITVTSPNGAESWVRGSTHTITWTSSGDVGSDVKLEVLKAESVVQTISAGTPNDGSYESWSILTGLGTGTDYRIRITSTTNPAITDSSNAYFTITSTTTPAITVTSPNGGESWIQGSNHAITWTSSGDVMSNVKIEVLKAEVVVQTLSSSDSNDGTFSWTIATALAAGTEYRIRITSTTNPAITDSSNANFAITPATTPAITVTAPNGAESWIQGSNHAITWTSTGDVGSNVKIEVLKAGSVVQTLSSSDPNDGTFSWTIATTLAAGTDYRIRITSTTTTAITDSSNANFAITSGTTTPSITVTSPNGGETWKRGTSYPITWSSTGSLGSSVNIALFNGNSFLNYITTNVPIGSGGSGSYTWQIPAGTATGSTYKIGVQSASQTSIYDLSNNAFGITS